MTDFNKPAGRAASLVDQWIERGLDVPDRARAEHYLSVVSYYRLSAYTLPFQCGNPEHHFKRGASFCEVLDLYIFDRQLRLLLLDAIERIEVALRARMTNVLAKNHGSHAYLNRAIFDTRYDHDWLLQQIRRKCSESQAETFIKHYCGKYKNPELPPIWMVMEILTFKEVSFLFSYLCQKEDKQAISEFWAIDDTVLRSWFRALSDLRNVCAHHARTWNREFGSKPMVPRKAPKRWPDLGRILTDPQVKPTNRLYYFLVVIEFLLEKVNPGSKWHERLYCLMREHPKVSKPHMGMPDDWADDPFWRLSGGEAQD